MVALGKNIVIAGGGIIGNAIAYHLAQKSIPVILIDPIGIAPAASSTAGGFLAKTWRDDTPLQVLQRLSFDLHQKMAKELGEESVGYRRLECHSVEIDGIGMLSEKQDLEWVDRGVLGSASMGDEEEIAQVHPKKLCEAMWEVSKSVGSKLQIGSVSRVFVKDEDHVDDIIGQGTSIQAIELSDGTKINTDNLVIACGPWTEHCREWFGEELLLPQISAVKCHSMLIKSDRILNQAVFFEGDNDIGEADVEVYPRPDGDAYVNGYQGEEQIISELPGEVKVDLDTIEQLKNAMKRTSSELGEIEPHTTHACYWPETSDGLPIIGPIPGVKGAFVATGHSVWGILNSAATGLAMSELLLDGESKSVDLSAFGIERFLEFDYDFVFDGENERLDEDGMK